MVNRITTFLKEKLKNKFGTSKFEYSEGPVEEVLRTSWRRPDLNSQGRPLNVRLGRSEEVRLERPQDVQIESLGVVLGANICRLGRMPWIEWTYH